MRRPNIFVKIFLSHAMVGMVSVIIFSLIFYLRTRDALIDRTIDQLASINSLKKRQIERYFVNTRRNISLAFANDTTNKVGSHTQISRWFEARFALLQTATEFKDGYLVDAQTQLITGTTPDSLLLNAVRKSGRLETGDVLDVSAMALGGLPRVVHVFPVQLNGRRTYIIIPDDLKRVQTVLSEFAGMGDTGESYLVGDDFRLRSASRFFPGRSPLTIVAKTQATTQSKVVSSEIPKIEHLIKDYRGTQVLSYYRLLEGTLPWVIVSEIDVSEAMKPVLVIRNYILWWLGVISIMVFISTFFLSRSIVRPIQAIKENILKLARGIIPGHAKVTSRDEIGEITGATNRLIESFRKTTEFAYAVGTGNLNAPYELLSKEDTLGQALVHMQRQLSNYHQSEMRLVREKTSSVLEAQESERERMVRELHDGVGQLLTAIRLRVEMLNDGHEKAEIMNMISETIGEVKRVSYNLMPNAILDFGLKAALKGLCDNTKKYSTIEIDFMYVQESNRPLNFEVSISVFRIVQEALNNILKHASATEMTLHVIEKEDDLYFVIRDNGFGFVESAVTLGAGLTNMRERARLLGGQLDIDSSHDGTCIECNIPR